MKKAKDKAKITALEAVRLLNEKYKLDIIKPASKIPPIRRVKFKEPAYNYITVGGTPINRITEILGGASSGKNIQAYLAIERFQKYCFNCNTNGSLKAKWKKSKEGFPVLDKAVCSNCKSPKTGAIVYIDYEGTADRDHMINVFDIDLEGMFYTIPEYPTMMINFIETFLRNSDISLILGDSVGMMSSDAEIENAAEDNKMNSGARVTNSAVRKWQAALNANVNRDDKSPTTLIVINRMYEKVGSFVGGKKVQGGGGLMHGKGMSVENIIVDRFKVQEGAEKGRILGVHRKLINRKNKTGFPFREAVDYVNLNPAEEDYGKPDLGDQYLDFAIKFKMVKLGGGGWYKFDEKRKYQGRAAAKKAILAQKDIIKKIDELTCK